MKKLCISLGALCVLVALAATGWWLVTRRHAVVRAVRGFPAGIVIHHTATPPVLNGKVVDVSVIDAMHARRGFRVVDADGTVYHIGYHYLILQDGTVQRGRPEHLWGSHTKNHNDMLGICLVGNFHRFSNLGIQGPLTPPHAQLQAAEALANQLMAKYGLAAKDVYLHRDLGQTACPGDHFPRRTFYAALVPAEPPTVVKRPWWSGGVWGR